MSNPEVNEPKFTKIAHDILGSEGPVFDRNGVFYMVAPEKENAGDVVRVNLENGQVRKRFSCGCQIRARDRSNYINLMNNVRT